MKRGICAVDDEQEHAAVLKGRLDPCFLLNRCNGSQKITSNYG